MAIDDHTSIKWIIHKFVNYYERTKSRRSVSPLFKSVLKLLNENNIDGAKAVLKSSVEVFEKHGD